MAVYTVLSLFLLILGFSYSAYVDTLTKCTIKDTECHKKLIKKVLLDISENGLKEYNIPPIDPIKLHNVDISILDVINMTMVEGTAKGVKKCQINKYEVKIDKSKAILDLTCDIVVKGKYRMVSESPVFKNLLGGTLHGEGDGKVKINKLNVKIDYYYKLTKKGDDIYLQRDSKKTKYTWDIQDKVTFTANNLYLGDKEASKEVIGILNENWKVIVSSFGGPFLDFAMKYVMKFIGEFLSNVATKYYIADDLTQYL